MQMRSAGWDAMPREAEGDWELEDMEASWESEDPEGEWEMALEGDGELEDMEGAWESEDPESEYESEAPEGEWEMALEGDWESGDMEGAWESEDMEGESEDLESEWEAEGESDPESEAFFQRVTRVPPDRLRRIARRAAGAALRGVIRPPSFANRRRVVRPVYRPSRLPGYGARYRRSYPGAPASASRIWATPRPGLAPYRFPYGASYRPGYGGLPRWGYRPAYGRPYGWRYQRPYGWPYTRYGVVRSYAPPFPEPYPVGEPTAIGPEPVPPPGPEPPLAPPLEAAIDGEPIPMADGGPPGPAPGGQEGEWEGAWEGEWEGAWNPAGSMGEMHAPAVAMSTEALMEHLGHAAAQAESDLEAEAFLGALVPLAAKLAPSLISAVPQLAKSIGSIGRSLRRSKGTKALVRTLPSALMATADGVAAMQAETGQPIRPDDAVRALARATGRLVGSPQASAEAYSRSRDLDAEYHDHASALNSR